MLTLAEGAGNLPAGVRQSSSATLKCSNVQFEFIRRSLR